MYAEPNQARLLLRGNTSIVVVMSKGHEKTVLIVEKQPNYTQVLVKQIIVAGLRPIVAVTGEGGLQKVQECHPDLILVEAELSDMNGPSFISEIRQKPEGDRIPIVAMSVFPELKAPCLDAGCNDFLQKPVRMIELMARIKKLIHSGSDLGPASGLRHEVQQGAELPDRTVPEITAEQLASPKQKETDPENTDELLILSLATAEALAKLLIEKGVITEEEYRDKTSQERDAYLRLLRRIGERRGRTS